MAPKKKGKAEPVPKHSAPPQAAQQRPNWPAFTPLIPEADLSMQELLPGQIVTVPSFWTATLCKNYVSFLSSLPLTTTPGKPKKGDAVRVNDRYQIDDPAFAERLWSGTSLKSLVETQPNDLWGGEPIGLNPNIRIYRYSKGQFFDQHCTHHLTLYLLHKANPIAPDLDLSDNVTDDDFNNVTVPGSPSTPARTTWTLLLYLTSPATGCIGGETVFYPDPPKKKSREPQPEPFVVGLEVGLALLHKHGADCMLHEGREVLQGEKWVIRSDLCVKR
jgi:hypothetical protein